MSELAFEECAEFVVEAVGEGSRYRATVVRFLGSGLERARIVCEFRGRAQRIANSLKLWVSPDEGVRVFTRGRMVYLVREPSS